MWKLQMKMLVSGEGGTGKWKIKTAVKHVLTKYTPCIPGKTEGVFGSVLMSAPTGAAYSILGHTWQSALAKNKSRDLC
jgi:hypothetical protein